MNKKIVGIILCTIMLATIPLAAAMPHDAGNAAENTGIFDRTVVKGIILGSKTEGRVTTFFALFVQYKTYSLLGEKDSGVLMLQKVSFTGKFVGKIGTFFIMGTFHGSPK